MTGLFQPQAVDTRNAVANKSIFRRGTEKVGPIAAHALIRHKQAGAIHRPIGRTAVHVTPVFVIRRHAVFRKPYTRSAAGRLSRYRCGQHDCRRQHCQRQQGTQAFFDFPYHGKPLDFLEFESFFESLSS